MDLYVKKTKERINTKWLVYCALLIALSFIGAQIKIFLSIAFDSLPAFIAALLLGPIGGAVVGIFGHLLTAITSGFPYSVPVHILVAVGMGGICFAFGLLKGKINVVLNCIIAILLNGVVLAVLATVLMLMLGMIPTIKETLIGLILILTPASAANVIIGAVLYKLIGDKVSI